MMITAGLRRKNGLAANGHSTLINGRTCIIPQNCAPIILRWKYERKYIVLSLNRLTFPFIQFNSLVPFGHSHEMRAVILSSSSACVQPKESCSLRRVFPLTNGFLWCDCFGLFFRTKFQTKLACGVCIKRNELPNLQVKCCLDSATEPEKTPQMFQKSSSTSSGILINSYCLKIAIRS